MADIKIAGRIKAGAADGISGYASEILFDDQASNKTVKEKIEEVASSPQTMIVTITPDGNDGYEADKTFAEIKAFIDNGGTVIAKDEEDGDSYYYLDNYIASEVVFTRNIWGSGGFSTRYYTIDNTDTVSFDDSVHHISSDVNSSSTANLANSAAVKAVKDDLANYVKKNTNDNSAVYFRNHNGVISISGDGFIEIDPNEQGDVQGNGNVMIYGDVSIPESLTVGGERVAVESDIPDELADLAGDSTHRTVTDAEKATWNGKQNALTFDNVPTANSNNPVKSGGVYQAIQDIDVSSQISGKADKSEMSVVAGTGANADKTTITLKSGTSATVLTQHQDVSGKEDKSNKVTSFSSPTDTQYPSAKLVSDQLATKQDTISDISTIRSNAAAGATAVQPSAMNTALAAKQDTISDLATIRSNAAAGATAYQKPGTGIPKTDLASAVQTSLGKADTAIQSVTVGTTTTGAAGSSASVTNTGTATEPVLSFTIPQGAQGIQGIQGPQGERGPQGNTGVTVESVNSIIHSIDSTATYAAADVAGADAVQDVLAEVTELAGEVDGVYNSIQRIIAGSELDEITIDAEMTLGTYISTNQGVGNECPLTTTSFQGADCTIINLKQNQVVNISGVGGNAMRLWAVLDNSTNKILSVAYANTSIPNSPYTKSIVASQDCKVVVNVYNENADPPYGNASQTPYSITVTSKGEGEGALVKMQKDINSINKKIEGISLIDTVETGFYFVDNTFNIGAYFDDDGFHAINMLEYEKI